MKTLVFPRSARETQLRRIRRLAPGATDEFMDAILREAEKRKLTVGTLLSEIVEEWVRRKGSAPKRN